VANVATLPGIVGYSLAMPDIHWGYGFPVGGVAATNAENGVVSPGGIGFDINCGVRLLATDLLFEQVRGKADKLADELFSHLPSGVGGAGMHDLTADEMRDVMVRGSAWAIEQGYVELYRNGRSRVHPLSIPRIMANAGASYISMEFGITGPVYTLSTACSSASHAIGHAYWMVRHGMVDRAIAGGSEAPFGLGHLKAWDALRVVAPDTCRPFSRDRRGLVLGEGGAMLVMESLESALKRDCPIHAEITGFGMSSDAYHITQPSIEGPARAMQAALRDGGVPPERVGYINAHGTGTPTNDQVETVAIRKVFGPHADRLAVSSTKSMHGHALGAAGAIEAIATVLALETRLVPPTANFAGPDPACDLDVVPNEARPLEVEYALSNSFAFGGLNAALALRRWSG